MVYHLLATAEEFLLHHTVRETDPEEQEVDLNEGTYKALDRSIYLSATVEGRCLGSWAIDGKHAALGGAQVGAEIRKIIVKECGGVLDTPAEDAQIPWDSFRLAAIPAYVQGVVFITSHGDRSVVERLRELRNSCPGIIVHMIAPPTLTGGESSGVLGKMDPSPSSGSTFEGPVSYRTRSKTARVQPC